MSSSYESFSNIFSTQKKLPIKEELANAVKQVVQQRTSNKEATTKNWPLATSHCFYHFFLIGDTERKLLSMMPMQAMLVMVVTMAMSFV